MNRSTVQVFRIWRTGFALLLSLAIAACAATPSAAPPPPKAVVYMPRSSDTPPPDEWNLLPDPTTGRVDVYHEGSYVGAVTGDEPADQDPPIPHPVAPAN